MRNNLFVCLRIVAILPVLFVAGPGQASDLLEQYAQALQFDPTFLAAQHEGQRAGANLAEFRAARLPSITANLESSKTFQDIGSSDNFLFTEGKSNFFNHRFSITLTQPLYRAPDLAAIPQARMGVRQADFALDAAEQDLILRLAEAYFGYLAAADSLEFATAEREALWRLLDETEERLSAGLANITDAHDARARHALAEAAEIDAQNALEESRLAIAEITADLPSQVAGLSDAFLLMQPDEMDVERWVQAALFQNPDVKVREIELEISKQEIRRLRGARKPTVELTATLSDSDSGGTVFGGGNEIATNEYALRVGVPIYDSGRTAARARNADLRYKVAAQNLEAVRRRVEREARVAFQRVVSGINRVAALQKSVFSQQAALAMREQGLRSGVDSQLDVLDARRDLFLARRDLSQARYIYVLNSLRLERSAGTLDIENVEQINAFLQ